ncbi:MAG: response regulator [Bacteroidota bacterium]
MRSHVSALVGHLELLRHSTLTGVQKARLDCALEEAFETADLLTEEAPTPLSRQHDDPSGPARQSLRVLIVEDNEANRHVLLGMLNVLGIQADPVATATEALTMMGAFEYDLVIMDVMLPGLDGAEATQRIRDVHGDRTAVVGLTAQPQARERCLEAGMDAFLLKPVRLNQISQVLDACATA